MSNSKKSRRNRRRYDEESHTSHRVSLSSPNDFELYAEDVWENNDAGRFAKARWSEGPRKRRSEWLRHRLDDAIAEVSERPLYISLRA